MAKPKIKTDELHFMPSGNRGIKPKVVKNLQSSIREYGILRSIVVVRTNVFDGTHRWYIADGQHLYMACQAEKILKQVTMIYVTRKFNNVKELVKFVATMNTTQSPWRLVDFVYAFASTHEYPSYNKIIAKKRKYSLSFNLLGIIYGEEGKSAASYELKHGEFWIRNEQRSDEIAEVVADLTELFGRVNSTALVKFAYAFTKWYRKLNFNKFQFKKYVETNLEKIMDSTEDEIYATLSNYELKGGS